jgi:hypothetical protein
MQGSTHGSLLRTNQYLLKGAQKSKDGPQTGLFSAEI